MKKMIFTLIPSLFFGLNAHLSSLEDTLKIQSQTSLNFIRTLFDGRQEDQSINLSSNFTHVKETHYTANKGLISLFSRSEDDSVFIPYIHYIYTELKVSDQKLNSHSIGVGIKSMIDADFISIISGISIGGNFDSISLPSCNYSYLFTNIQLGLGEETELFDSRLKIAPMAYVDYNFIYQKALKDISLKEQNLHDLSMIIGGQVNLGLFQSEATIVSLIGYGFYKHIFIGQEITAQNTRTRNKDSGYLGGGINWKTSKIILDFDIGSEFTKHTYTLQGLARIGVEF